MLVLYMSQKTQGNATKNGLPFLLGLLPSGKTPIKLMLAQALTTTAIPFSMLKLFLVFLKIGAVLFGSGYVLIAYLDGELVQGLHWLTKPQLLDAVAIGQFTPGPVLSTATFIGYQVAAYQGMSGILGAIIATVGIFLPSFFFVLVLNPIVPKLRKNKWASLFLDAVNASALGLMAAVTLLLAYDTVVDWQNGVIAVLAGIYQPLR